MRRCNPKSVERSGDEGPLPMKRCTTKSFEAEATGLRCLNGCSTKRKADKEAAVSGHLGAPMKGGTTKRMASSDCSEVDNGGEPAAEAVAEEEMKATDFVVAYKRLPRREIEFILASVRVPFESTITYNYLIADSSTTKEDLDREAAEHEEAQESFLRFQERVRREYEAHGVFKVDEEYIANRVKKQACIEEGWSTMFDGLDLHDSDFGYQSDSDDLEDIDEVTSSAMENRKVE